MIDRQYISHRFIRGSGIEIGAYHNPWPARPDVQVTYIDKHPYEKLIEMRDRDPNLGPNKPIARVDLIDDGETLAKVGDNSQDFVLSSHQLEHCFSPITAIKNHLRVLKPGGVICYAVPDKRFTFDKERGLTSLGLLWKIHNHLISNEELKKALKVGLYCEYYRIVDKVHEDDLTDKALLSYELNLDIHFHCWDAQTLAEMFSDSVWHTYFDIELFSRAGHENFVVLRKL